MLAMMTRRYDLPDHSFFLFGPRGTGKTTWLKHVLPDALWFDLLRTQVVLALSRQPESFRQQVDALLRGRRRLSRRATPLEVGGSQYPQQICRRLPFALFLPFPCNNGELRAAKTGRRRIGDIS